MVNVELKYNDDNILMVRLPAAAVGEALVLASRVPDLERDLTAAAGGLREGAAENENLNRRCGTLQSENFELRDQIGVLTAANKLLANENDRLRQKESK